MIPILRTGWLIVLGAGALLACGGEPQQAASAPAALTLQPCARWQQTAGDAEITPPPSSLKPSPAMAASGLDANAECGSLAVAENPANPAGRQIALKVVRLPALSTTPAADPLFVFSGGPGQAATDLARMVPPLLRRINQQRDIVLVDQRGTGASNALDCAIDIDDWTLTAEESFAEQQRLLRDCLAGYDADLRFYTTPFAVDDINQVRLALGYQSINLWGISYGTRVALDFMRRHPSAVRSATLDGVAPPALSLPFHISSDADAALQRLFAFCEADAACRDQFGDLARKTRDLIARLNAEPRRVTIEHPLTGDAVDVTLSGTLVASALRLGLYVRDWAPLLPLAIDSASRGDFRPVLVLLLESQAFSEGISLGMQQTVLCAEDIRPNQARPLPAVDGGLLQLDLVSEARAICAFWPEGVLPADYFEPVRSELPVLLISGALDPVTPPRWPDTVAAHLDNSHHLIVPGAHHGASLAGCVAGIVDDFIAAADHRKLDLACVARITPKALFVSPAGPAMRDPQQNDAPAGNDAPSGNKEGGV